VAKDSNFDLHAGLQEHVHVRMLLGEQHTSFRRRQPHTPLHLRCSQLTAHTLYRMGFIALQG